MKTFNLLFSLSSIFLFSCSNSGSLTNSEEMEQSINSEITFDVFKERAIESKNNDRTGYKYGIVRGLTSYGGASLLLKKTEEGAWVVKFPEHSEYTNYDYELARADLFVSYIERTVTDFSKFSFKYYWNQNGFKITSSWKMNDNSAQDALYLFDINGYTTYIKSDMYTIDESGNRIKDIQKEEGYFTFSQSTIEN
ncbi:MAG: hypothetical protein SPL02_00950 [Bacilli bacterium]|nr:hypothetical protein [Bacilli bacterium]